jgi:hypothetical protein
MSAARERSEQGPVGRVAARLMRGDTYKPCITSVYQGAEE